MTVVNDGGNKYRFYDENLNGGQYVGDGESPTGIAPELQFVPGFTYVFKQENVSNETHPLFITTTETYSSDDHYTGMVETTVGENGVGRVITVTIPENASPTDLWYNCSAHGGMGNTSNIVEDTSGEVSAPPSDVEVTGAQISISGESIELSGVGFDEAFKTYMEANYSGGIFYNVDAATTVEIQQSDILSWGLSTDATDPNLIIQLDGPGGNVLQSHLDTIEGSDVDYISITSVSGLTDKAAIDVTELDIANSDGGSSGASLADLLIFDQDQNSVNIDVTNLETEYQTLTQDMASTPSDADFNQKALNAVLGDLLESGQPVETDTSFVLSNANYTLSLGGTFTVDGTGGYITGGSITDVTLAENSGGATLASATSVTIEWASIESSLFSNHIEPYDGEVGLFNFLGTDSWNSGDINPSFYADYATFNSHVTGDGQTDPSNSLDALQEQIVSEVLFALKDELTEDDMETADGTSISVVEQGYKVTLNGTFSSTDNYASVNNVSGTITGIVAVMAMEENGEITEGMNVLDVDLTPADPAIKWEDMLDIV